jgi:hypothetical protein
MSSSGPVQARLARLATNPARAIYGSIVATAVIAASSAHEESALRVAEATAITLVVFWLAHVYSAILEHRFEGNEFRMSVIPKVMAEELPMVESPAVAIAILLAGALGWISDDLAINLALAAGVAQLLMWGVIGARRLGWSWPATIVAGLIDAAFGLIVIALKAIVH